MSRRIEPEPYLLKRAMERNMSTSECTVRIVVRALSHVMEMTLRNGKALALPWTAFGTGEQLDAIERWEADRHHTDEDLSELFGEDVESLIDPNADAAWLITLTDVWPIITRRTWDVDPSISEDDIDDVVLSACRILVEDDVTPGLALVAPEVVIEDWIERNLQEVSNVLDFGTLVAPDLPGGGRQHRFSDGARADLICRLSEDARRLPAGTWFVLELKAGRALERDIDQLTGYLDRVEDELRRNDESVVGVLIADSIPRSVTDRIRALDLPITTLTLTQIGYLDYAYQRLIDLEALAL